LLIGFSKKVGHHNDETSSTLEQTDKTIDSANDNANPLSSHNLTDKEKKNDTGTMGELI
jgi:hypothetical protein